MTVEQCQRYGQTDKHPLPPLSAASGALHTNSAFWQHSCFSHPLFLVSVHQQKVGGIILFISCTLACNGNANLRMRRVSLVRWQKGPPVGMQSPPPTWNKVFGPCSLAGLKGATGLRLLQKWMLESSGLGVNSNPFGVCKTKGTKCVSQHSSTLQFGHVLIHITV